MDLAAWLCSCIAVYKLWKGGGEQPWSGQGEFPILTLCTKNLVSRTMRHNWEVDGQSVVSPLLRDHSICNTLSWNLLALHGLFAIMYDWNDTWENGMSVRVVYYRKYAVFMPNFARITPHYRPKPCISGTIENKVKKGALWFCACLNFRLLSFDDPEYHSL